MSERERARDEPPGYQDPQLGWLPTTTRDQSCLCGDQSVVWLYPLASDKVRYREYDKGHILPTFWTLCERCESLYTAGADDELVDLMQRARRHDQPAQNVCGRGVPAAACRIPPRRPRGPSLSRGSSRGRVKGPQRTAVGSP